MGDWTLSIDGDASGASAALNQVGKDTATLHQQATSMGDAQRKQSEEFWGGVMKAAAAAAAAITAFGVASVKAFMEADRIQKQLTRATGEYSEALGQQADAMEALFNVDAEAIKQSQTLLAQWGGVGAASEDVERAVIDLAAAMHTDLNTATTELIRNVESGGTGLAKMGVHFDATGNKGEDLSRIVEAIGKKFGGAGAADADSLHGQVEGVRIGFGNLMEDFGQFIAQVAAKTGVIEHVRDAIASWREVMFGNKDQEAREENLATMEALNGRIEWRKKLIVDLQHATDQGSARGIEQNQRLFVENEKSIAQLKEQLRLKAEVIAGGTPGIGAVTGRTNRGMKDDDSAAKAAETHNAKMEKIQQKNLDDFREFQKSWDELDLHARQKEEKLSADMLKRIEDQSFDVWDTIADNEKKSAEKLGDAMAAVADVQHKAFEKEKQAWADAGNAIGGALVNSISDQLQRLANGEDLDAGEVMANILGDVLAVAGQVIGTAVGAMYGNAQLGGAVGAAAGGLAGAGVKALGKAGRKPRTYHEGGPIEDEGAIPRFHSGGPLRTDEMHLIGQKGEHMLSRRDVANMGGHAGVQAAKTGGAQFNVTVHTIDSQGTRQFFENDGGRGFFNALRTGRGSLLPAFGGG